MDPISDMLIRIKNAQMAKAEQVLMPFSRVKFQIAQILRDGGYISSIERRKRKGRKSELEYLELGLVYHDSEGAIGGIKLLSKPSRPMDVSAQNIQRVRSGHGFSVISTSKGIMNSLQARKQNLGGEILFEIW